MAKFNQPDLSSLLHSVEAAGLLKNKNNLISLLQGPDGQKLMQLLSASGGANLQNAVSKGDFLTIANMLGNLTNSKEGAALLARIQQAAKK